LYDHIDLGWVNLLQIGMIWVDIKVQYQKILMFDWLFGERQDLGKVQDKFFGKETGL
jgi:hypothetical protein